MSNSGALAAELSRYGRLQSGNPTRKRRNPASQPRTLAIKSSNGVQSPRITELVCPCICASRIGKAAFASKRIYWAFSIATFAVAAGPTGRSRIWLVLMFSILKSADLPSTVTV